MFVMTGFKMVLHLLRCKLFLWSFSSIPLAKCSLIHQRKMPTITLSLKSVPEVLPGERASDLEDSSSAIVPASYRTSLRTRKTFSFSSTCFSCAVQKNRSSTHRAIDGDLQFVCTEIISLKMSETRRAPLTAQTCLKRNGLLIYCCCHFCPVQQSFQGEQHCKKKNWIDTRTAVILLFF